MNVSYNGNVRFSTATQIPEMPNSYDFARYWNDAAANSGGNAPFSQDMLNKIKNHINGTPAPGEEVTTTWQGTAAMSLGVCTQVLGTILTGSRRCIGLPFLQQSIISL